MLPGVMLLLLLLLRWSQAHGGCVGNTGPGLAGLLAPPGRVRFEAETFQHVLRWEAPPGAAAGLRYDVQYRRYGERDWTPVGHCTRVASRACDLSEETWDPSKRYYAHVRALAGNRTSGWALSIPFHPPEGKNCAGGEELRAPQTRAPPAIPGAAADAFLSPFPGVRPKTPQQPPMSLSFASYSAAAEHGAERFWQRDPRQPPAPPEQAR
uniref:Fibronectin type-III domain-containing protein n=1 Tax=Salvator merianae TaxID=96440 RepID=A0A8D0KNA5_SALMN